MKKAKIFVYIMLFIIFIFSITSCNGEKETKVLPQIQDQKQTKQMEVKEPAKVEEQTEIKEPTIPEETKESNEPISKDSLEAEEQTTFTETINGTIVSVGNNEFTIQKINVSTDDTIMYFEENAQEITISYSDYTEFVLCSSSDGGITANYTEASKANLEKQKQVEIIGAYEGSVFVAQKITIYHFD